MNVEFSGSVGRMNDLLSWNIMRAQTKTSSEQIPFMMLRDEGPRGKEGNLSSLLPSVPFESSRRILCERMQRSAEVGAPGLVNFSSPVAYHLCPSLPAAFTQPGASTLADLCT